jgi:hypothetical protein
VADNWISDLPCAGKLTAARKGIPPVLIERECCTLESAIRADL